MSVFSRTGTLNPGRSVFNLSYEKKFTCDMGQLIPVMCDEVVPGDVFKIGNQFVIRMQPLVAPVLHEIDVTVHYFFVPYRILWEDWESFITGGEDGDDASVMPIWDPGVGKTAVGSLWDYLGFPTAATDPIGAYPLDFVRRAYARIFNEYYRPQEIMAEVAETNEDILYRAWRKDYFTAALLEQQRGTAPSLPVSGSTSAVWAGSIANGTIAYPAVTNANSATLNRSTDDSHPYDAGTKTALEHGTVTIPQASLNANTVDLSSATTFDVAELRLAIQMQRILERNNRAGARYVEWLNAHFGVHPRDDRLQRPEYIGGSKSPVIISEVLQTSKTDTVAPASPQGNLAGHGIAANRQFCGSYRSSEFGLIMGIMSIMPAPVYNQGINRQWNSGCKSTKWDFYMPELAHLSEQAILRSEIYATNVHVDNDTIFGYAGRYDEMRYKPNMVVGEMASTFDYWHLARQFAAAPELNSTFIMTSSTSPRKDIFAAPTVPGFLVSFGNVIKAIRPIPIMSNPGLADH